jgi:hypothetical protein
MSPKRTVQPTDFLFRLFEFGRLEALEELPIAIASGDIDQAPIRIRRIPPNGLFRSRRFPLTGRLTHLPRKGRDVVSGGAAYCKKLVGQ